MRFLLGLFLLLTSSIFAQEYRNVAFLDNWHDSTLLTTSSKIRYNDCWGYTKDGKDYAMIGSTEGVHFFSIENEQLVYIDSITGSYSHQWVIHRDIKTYDHYAYMVCDEGPSTLQIVDLDYLPDSVHLVNTISTNFGRVHNLFIDDSNKRLYALSVTTIAGGIDAGFTAMKIFSLEDPINPTLLHSFTNVPLVHDAYIKNNIAYLNCGLDGLRVYDFTNPTAPVYKQNLDIYDDQGYNHQGWLSPNGTTYLFADETQGMRIKKCTVATDGTVEITQNFGTNYSNNSVPHNIWSDDAFAYVAYYQEGLRIYDIRNFPSEVAYYDTYPTEDAFKMNGAWGVYKFALSNQILVSDRVSGLYLLSFDSEQFLVPKPDCSVSTFITGNNTTLKIEFPPKENDGFKLEILNEMGQPCLEEMTYNYSYAFIPTYLPTGIYFLKITPVDSLESIIKKVVIH